MNYGPLTPLLIKLFDFGKIEKQVEKMCGLWPLTFPVIKLCVKCKNFKVKAK